MPLRDLSILIALLVLLAGSSAPGPAAVVNAAGQNTAAHEHPAQASSADPATMHEKMMADMKAADERLDALVKTMNATAGDAKTNAIAAVVNELVIQQKAMHTHMHAMHMQMMNGSMMNGSMMGGPTMGGRGSMMGGR